MGMYTGLRGTVELKQNVAEALTSYWYDDNGRYSVWQYIGAKTGCAETLAFSQDYRSSFIPHGVVCYMPDDWAHECELVGNTLTICCSLKNYDNTIGKFLELLPSIATAWELEKLREGDCGSEFFNEGDENE